MSNTTPCPECRGDVIYDEATMATEAVRCPGCGLAFWVAPPETFDIAPDPPPVPKRRFQRAGESDGRLRRRDWFARPRRTRSERKRWSADSAETIGTMIGLVLGLSAVALIVILEGCPQSKRRDSDFDSIQIGMSEQEVVDRLRFPPWSHRPTVEGTWTHPRRSLESHQKDPTGWFEIEDVIVVQFRDGKVADVRRISGADFRRTQPGK